MRALRLQTPHMAAEVSAADLSEDDDSDSDACVAAMESMHELEPEQAPLTRRRSSANPGPELGPGSSANQGAALGATSSSDANQGAALGARSRSGANQGPALGAAGAGGGGDRLEGQARAQRGQRVKPRACANTIAIWCLLAVPVCLLFSGPRFVWQSNLERALRRTTSSEKP